MTAQKHKVDEARFHAEMVQRGWIHLGTDWVLPIGVSKSKAQMEQDWRDALLAAVWCPHEEAGTQ